jgi:hypothetical protein
MLGELTVDVAADRIASSISVQYELRRCLARLNAAVAASAQLAIAAARRKPRGFHMVSVSGLRERTYSCDCRVS